MVVGREASEPSSRAAVWSVLRGFEVLETNVVTAKVEKPPPSPHLLGTDQLVMGVVPTG